MPNRYTNPVLDRDFPDPNVIRAADGWCYGYATQALGERPVVNIQVARSRDMVAWDYLGEALPERPPWARTTQMLWAPHVVEHGGVYVMAYSAAPDDPPYPAPPDDPALCLGLALSDSPAGPFTDAGAPLHCGPTTSDIDPCVFRDPAGGGWYCYWGSGGDIVVQEVAEDLRSFAPGSQPRLLLRGWSAEPKLPFEHGIEGPFVVERDGWYHLWYSGDRTWTYPPNYATMVARSRAPDGPFERRADGSSQFVLRDNDRWRGPGHNSVIRDDAGDDWVVYHAIDSRRPWLFEGQVRRVMLIDRIEYVDGWPAVGDGTPGVGERAGPLLESRSPIGEGVGSVAMSTDDPRRIFTPDELEYFNRAPAFDRTVLGRAADRWQELQARHGGPPIAWICLRNGERLAVSKVQVAITYADCELEDGSIRLIDLRAIEQIAIEPRPDDQPEPAHHPPGFWVEADPGAQAATKP